MSKHNVVRLRYKSPNVWAVRGVTLLPGINVLNREQYERLREHPMFKLRFRLGYVEEVSGRPASITPADVAELYDVQKLRELAQGQDKKLATAALKQLERIDEETRRQEQNNPPGGDGKPKE